MLLVSADVALELLILLWVLRCVHARQGKQWIKVLGWRFTYGSQLTLECCTLLRTGREVWNPRVHTLSTPLQQLESTSHVGRPSLSAKPI